MEHTSLNGISIQVSLSGFSVKIEEGEKKCESGWLAAGKVFTEQDLQKRYDKASISLFTPKCSLVPSDFFCPGYARKLLSDSVRLEDTDTVNYIEVPQFGAVMVYSNSIGESLSKVISDTVCTVDGNRVSVLPELYYVLNDFGKCRDYNKIVASYRDGFLYLAVSQGKSLRLCNVFSASDFTTAEYFIFLVMKKLQLNPEVSVICFRTPLSAEEEMSLYRYFSSVEKF
ncbi:MAG: DUF3822 family protein [Bacteroidales bacterium]|jgi:hypothetical protein|nr:DUF3822 family protein [Bacteroidales bacterium]